MAVKMFLHVMVSPLFALSGDQRSNHRITDARTFSLNRR